MTSYYSGHDVVLSLLYAICHDIVTGSTLSGRETRLTKNQRLVSHSWAKNYHNW